MLNVYVIGCGGIGGYLLQLLPQSIASMTLELNEYFHSGSSSELLETAGQNPVACPVKKLCLVDGDDFDPHNAVRQAAGTGSKLDVQLTTLENSMLKKVWLSNMELYGVNTYATPMNLNKIITADTPTESDLRAIQPIRDIEGYTAFRDYSLEGRQHIIRTVPVVFLCVDNHKTRYEISKFMEQFNSCVVINGGNDKVTGNVTVWQKLDGQELDPKLYELYPEVKDKQGKRPDEVACGEVQRQNDQIAIVNSMIAATMCNFFRKIFTMPECRYDAMSKNLDQPQRDGSTQRINEVILDVTSFTMFGLHHDPTN